MEHENTAKARAKATHSFAVKRAGEEEYTTVYERELNRKETELLIEMLKRKEDVQAKSRIDYKEKEDTR